MTTRRETLEGVVLLAAADKVNDGGLAPVTPQGVPERTRLLPPGAGERERFERRCVACGLCMRACPEGILRPSARLRTLGQPEMDFRAGSCLLGCVRCMKVCPSGALQPIHPDMKAHLHLGYAQVDATQCVRQTKGDVCTACQRKCPVQAIHLVRGFPVVEREKCIGCGACEHVCPARPQPAIYVKGYNKQLMIKPISEEDLISEMRTLLTRGEATLVVARDGVILQKSSERGLRPLLGLFDAGLLRRAVVTDKVVGRAAAVLYAEGGARRVITTLASEGAAEICRAAGVALEADKTVPTIFNRERTGVCPLEKSVDGLTDNHSMLQAIRKTLERINKK